MLRRVGCDRRVERRRGRGGELEQLFDGGAQGRIGSGAAGDQARAILVRQIERFREQRVRARVEAGASHRVAARAGGRADLGDAQDGLGA